MKFLPSRSLESMGVLALLGALGMFVLSSPELLGQTEVLGSLDSLVFWILGAFVVGFCGVPFWLDLFKIFYHPTRNAFVALSVLCLLLIVTDEPAFWKTMSTQFLWAAWVVALSLWIPVFESITRRKWDLFWKNQRSSYGLPETIHEEGPLPARASLFFLLGAGLTVIIFWGLREGAWRAGLESASLFFVMCLPFSSRHSMPLIRLSAQIRSLRRHVWIRKPEAVDRLEDITSVAFDKTGSLTIGKPTVTQVFSIENISHKEVLQFAASAEKEVQHPYATAIVEKAKSDGTSLLEIGRSAFEPGKGVKAQVLRDGKTHELVVGSLIWLYENGLNASEVPQDLLWNAGGVEESLCWVMRDQEPIGVIALHDRYREDAQNCVQSLIDSGYDVGLITGDSENVAQRFAKELNLKFSHAGVMAVEKATVIKRLSEKKKKALDVIYPKVMFVANASQERPALEEAHLSWGLCPKTEWQTNDFHIVSSGDNLQEIVEGVRILQSSLQTRSQHAIVETLFHIAALSWAAGLWTFLSMNWRGNPVFGAGIAVLFGAVLLFNSVRRIQH
jgi:cation transport ATPase